MQFVVERNIFLKELTRVTGVIQAKSTISILANVRIDAGAGGLLLRATDLDMEAEACCDADVTSQGLTTVDGRLLADLVRRYPDGAQIAATLEPDRGRLKLVCGRTRSTLPVLPAEDFPTISGVSGGVEFLLPADALKRMIARVKFAVGTDEHRPYLHGIYFHRNNNGLAGVTTDGHRLGILHLDLPEGADGMSGVILPRGLIAELERLLPKEGEIAIQLSTERIALTIAEFKLVSLLVAATFPDYQRLIPAPTNHRAFVNREALLRAVDRVRVVKDEKDKALQITVGSGEMRLAMQNPARGVCFDAVDAEYEGDGTTVGLNGRYLTDALNALDCDRICIQFGDHPMHPTKITNAETPDGPDLIVQMPVLVSAIKEEKEAA